MTSGSARRPVTSPRGWRNQAARTGDSAGFTYITLMFAVAIMGVLLAATGQVWSQSGQRDKERELLFIGDQFREAIALYYQRSPGVVKRYPEKLEDLLEDKRYLSMKRHLRKIYRDPFTGKAEWGLVPAPGGGIMGVYSLSPQTPIKTGNFQGADQAFSGGNHYSEWKFTYEPPPAVGGSLPARRN